ncbi:A disintegrin and metalloproteinase with thrombospondin motifs like [Epargyreus clarus]|uniref:A disintegrin and metalloproteinase with thrombospondin motifs like n=1 Tax=Epargyreus clarus TaxID=520877 RepID=UPI003C2EDF9B
MPLGSIHDGQLENTLKLSSSRVLTVPSTKRCKNENSNIMTTMSDFKNNLKANQLFHWSPCSISNIGSFLQRPEAQCLYNLPQDQMLPGQLLSLDDQCRRQWGPTSRACDYGPGVCTQLQCWVPGRNVCDINQPAADGSSCGQGKIHEHMTAAELQQVFQVEHHTHVPQYHPVQLTHHISRRNVPIDHPANTRSRKPERSNHDAVNDLKTSQQLLKNDELFIKGKQYIKDMIQLNNKKSEQFVASSSSENIGDGSNGDEIQDKEHAVEEQETDVHKIELEAFGKQIKLVLKKQEGLVSKDGLRMWRAIRDESQPFGVAYEEINSEGEEEIGDLYHDDENGAALLIRRHPKHKSLLVEGSIGDDLVIKAIPDSMTIAAQKDDGFMDSSRMANSVEAGLAFGKRKSTEQKRLKLALRGAQHVIIKRDIVHNNSLSDYAFMKPSLEHKKVKRNSDYRANMVPDTVYPEILVFADYEEYAHGGREVDVQRYFVALFNAVALRYKGLTNPKIRLSVVGVVLSTPFLRRQYGGSIGNGGMNADQELLKFGQYIYKEKAYSRLPSHDIAAAFTKGMMCRGGDCSTQACDNDKYQAVSRSVALIRDNGGFSGIYVITHELGHLLGSTHDGEPQIDQRLPSTERCRAENSNIMTPMSNFGNNRKAKQLFLWSPCSIYNFRFYLNRPEAQCLYNLPQTQNLMTGVLPGQLLSLDDQCRRQWGPTSRACDYGPGVCTQLQCWVPEMNSCSIVYPAADGSSCGQGKYCIAGQCVAERT